jgi:adenosylhomocysteine nucleosidase
MIVVLISANTEWKAIRGLLPAMRVEHSSFGEWGEPSPDSELASRDVVLFHGGWGKIDAAASTQHVIDRLEPELLVNIGTCGGIAGEVDVGQILLAEKTIVYDIHEKMFDPDESIAAYTTDLDLDWVKEPPANVKRSLLVSGDSDLDPGHIGMLKDKYGAVAADWESGAIAHVCKRNRVPCLILRGVSDLVTDTEGEAYDDPEIFVARTREIMSELLQSLPLWIEQSEKGCA